jgi:hypothetical protein
MNKKPIEIQVVFIGKPQWEAGWPYIGYYNKELIDNIMEHLTTKFSELSLHQNDIITTYNAELVNEIKSSLVDADGLIIFTIGHYGDPGLIDAGIEIIESKEIPCLLANLVYAGDHTFIKIYTLIKEKNYQVYPISSQRFKDFDKYIGILYNILRLKGEKIFLLATESREMNWNKILEIVKPERKEILHNHPEFLNQIGTMRDNEFEFFTDLEGADQAHPWRVHPEFYQKQLLETFGVELVHGDPDEIVKYYDAVEKEEAEKIAEKWIKEADEVQPTRGTIINSAKVYLALKKLLKEQEYKYNVFAPDCGTLLLLGKFPAYPCMAFFELSKENIYGICESDTNSAISFLLGLYLTGRPGYVSNHTLDLINDRVTYMHCVAPCDYYGEGGKFLNYDIVYHGESNFLGASPRVKFPKGELVTTVKISVAKRKMALRQGIIIENVQEPGGCVAKIWVKDNVKKILENYDWETFRRHFKIFLPIT